MAYNPGQQGGGGGQWGQGRGWAAPGAAPPPANYQTPPQGGYNPGAPPAAYNQGAPQGGYQGTPAGYNPGAPQGGYNQGAPAGYNPGAPQQGGYNPGAPQAGYNQGGYNQGAPQQGGYGAPAGYAAPAPPGVSPDLWNWFQTVDQDRSGQITAQELQQALMNGNWTPFNQETCRLMIGMFDRDKSGTINAQEFAALWKYIQDWKSCFDRFDTDRSGKISARELTTAFNTFGYRLSENFSRVCVLKFDRARAGEINFDDFIQCCAMLKSLTEKFRKKDANQTGNIQVHYEEFLEMVLDNTL